MCGTWWEKNHERRLGLVCEGYCIMLRGLDFILKSPTVKQGSDMLASVCLIVWKGLEERKAGVRTRPVNRLLQ